MEIFKLFCLHTLKLKWKLYLLEQNASGKHGVVMTACQRGVWGLIKQQFGCVALCPTAAIKAKESHFTNFQDGQLSCQNI